MTQTVNAVDTNEQIDALIESAELLTNEAKRRNCDTFNTRLQYTAQNKYDLEGPTEADAAFGRFAKIFIDTFFANRTIINNDTFLSFGPERWTDRSILFMGLTMFNIHGFPSYRVVMDIYETIFYIKLTRKYIQITVSI